MARVLIVDDEKGLREALAVALSQQGYEVTAVENALKAQQILNTQAVDIVLSDICMPRISGVELLKSIHDLYPQIKVILITANPSVETAKEAIRANAFDYLTKPVSRMELLKTVENAVQMARLEQENERYRKNLEQLVEEQTREIRENERKYRLLAENASDVIWTMDLGFQLSYISPSVTRLLGYEVDELYKSFLNTILTPESFNMALKFLKREYTQEKLLAEPEAMQHSHTLELEHLRKDGSTLWAEIQLDFILGADGQPLGILGITRDISDRKKIELELMESEENFRNLAENATVGIIISLEGRKQIYANQQATALTGYPLEELFELTVENLLAPEEYMKIINFYKLQVFSRRQNNRYESVLLRKNGSKLPVEISSTKTIWHGTPADLIFLQDISERKQWENNLERERDRIKQYLDIVDVIIVAVDARGEVTLINRKGREILGYKEEEILGRNWITGFLPQDEYGHAVNIFNKFMQGELEPFYNNESRILTKKREERIIAWRNVALHDEAGNICGMLSSGEDITNKLAMEVQLRSSEKRLNTIINSNADGILVTDSRGIVLFANPAAERLLSKRTREIIGSPLGFHVASDSVSEIEILHNDKEKTIIAEMTVVDIEWAGRSAFLVILRDITTRKMAQDEVIRLSQFQKGVIDNANVWLYVRDTQGNIVVWNRAAENLSGYSQQEVIGSNRVWQWLYPYEEQREQWLDRIDEALAEDKIIEDLETVIHTRSEEEKTILWYIRNMYNNDDRVVGSLAMGRDITLQKSTEERLQASFEKLQRALSGAIKAVILILENRDPYTSGHQKRVAEIAKTIAQEMELPTDTVEAVYIAGSMHDIGKISVPVEILSKPGKLTGPEFAIIKRHPEIGYNILGPIEFPWPIADIVYQHHEMCDGSGYPRGLQGEEIRIEAKILAVADVIEAISSDRPYRPAIGLSEAVAEISRARGTKFDEQVVEATLRLYHKQQYNFGIRQEAN